MSLAYGSSWAECKVLCSLVPYWRRDKETVAAVALLPHPVVLIGPSAFWVEPPLTVRYEN